ncbi:MAG: oligosaccharide flippase family protein [Vicinamibacterales bacterium]
MSVIGSAPRSFVARIAAMGTGEFVSKAAVTLSFVYLARVLTPQVYGEVEWALSLLMVGTLVADAGFGSWASAHIGAHPEEAPRVVAQVGWLRAALTVMTASVLLVVAYAYGGGAGRALAVYSAALLLMPVSLGYLFNGLGRPEWAALGSALRGAVFAGTVVWLVRAGSPSWHVALAEVAGALALALSSVAAARFSVGLRVPVAAGRTGALGVLGQSWRIGASEITWGVQWYAGLILLGYLGTTTDAAWYSAGLRLVLALHTMVWLYLYVLLPGLSRSLASNPARWRDTVEHSLRLTGWIGCGIALVGTLGARPLLVAVFGDPFVAAVPAFRTLVWVLPIAWASGHLRYSFIAAGRARHDYHAALIGAGTTVVLTLVLTPLLRSLGAALALVGGVATNAVVIIVLSRRVLPPVSSLASVSPGAAGCVVCLILGAILTPVSGDLPAALVAGLLLASLALFFERGRWSRYRTHVDF